MRWIECQKAFAGRTAQVEAMRWAWRDRLTLLGDPNMPPFRRQLLSKEYAKEVAEKILRVVDERKLISHRVTPHGRAALSISARSTDMEFRRPDAHPRRGLGACVTVDAFGLTLGHGMTRFDPNPDHPNAPRPGKRPLHTWSRPL